MPQFFCSRTRIPANLLGHPGGSLRAYNVEQDARYLRARGLMLSLTRDAGPPSDKHLNQSSSTLSPAQQGYRDLIDSFDDVLLAISLEGQIRAVKNRSFFSDLVDTVDRSLSADYRRNR